MILLASHSPAPMSLTKHNTGTAFGIYYLKGVTGMLDNGYVKMINIAQHH